MELGASIPILRIFDEAKAREFYLDYLAFKVDFEHRFEPEAPLYIGISRGGCQLNLSEHHGDACPGSGVRIPVKDIDGLQAELIAKPYRYYRPGIQDMPWGLREMKLVDPFGNRLLFYGVP